MRTIKEVTQEIENMGGGMKVVRNQDKSFVVKWYSGGNRFLASTEPMTTKEFRSLTEENIREAHHAVGMQLRNAVWELATQQGAQ